MRKRILELKMENEILTKAAAIFILRQHLTVQPNRKSDVVCIASRRQYIQQFS